MTPAEREELRALLDALAEEVITPDQVRRLEGLVLADPEAEAFYVQFMALVADLDRHFAAAPPPPERAVREPVERAEPVRPAARRSRARLWTLGLVALAGCVLVAGVLVGLSQWPRPIVIPPPRTGPIVERTDESVAVLLQTHNALWEDTGMPTRPGSPLPPGRLVLKSGHAHLEFYNGATVILEGPAELRLVSRTQAFCERGKLRATVPPQAHGFAIGSPSMDLIDRGTEFGLAVGGDKTEVHVFQGEVDVYNPGADPKGKALQVVTGGHGVSRQGPGAVQPIRPQPGSFVSAAEMAARAEAMTRQRQAEWAEASQALRKDPALALYYPFQDAPARSRTLHDAAADGKPRDGAIVGCQWGAGRWQGRDGLEFKRVSDRVRVKLPGEFPALTLAAWVRPDALPNQNNSLFMADGWETGGAHWQIGTDGTIILGVKAPTEQEKGLEGRGYHYRAYNVFTPELLGRWVHLAVVYDPAAGLVTHYVDGKPRSPDEMLFPVPLTFGDAELGNWNPGTLRNKHPVRNFTGAMDEFMLFRRALSQAEVERLYDQGRPPG